MQSRAVTRAAKKKGTSSDASEGEYLKVANEFAAKLEAVKERVAENVRRRYKADRQYSFERIRDIEVG